MPRGTNPFVEGEEGEVVHQGAGLEGRREVQSVQRPDGLPGKGAAGALEHFLVQ